MLSAGANFLFPTSNIVYAALQCPEEAVNFEHVIAGWVIVKFKLTR